MPGLSGYLGPPGGTYNSTVVIRQRHRSPTDRGGYGELGMEAHWQRAKSSPGFSNSTLLDTEGG